MTAHRKLAPLYHCVVLASVIELRPQFGRKEKTMYSLISDIALDLGSYALDLEFESDTPMGPSTRIGRTD